MKAKGTVRHCNRNGSSDSVFLTIIIFMVIISFLSAVVSATIVHVLGHEIAEQIERLFLPQNHPITKIIHFVQFVIRLANFSGITILLFVFGIVLPPIGIITFFWYFSIFSESMGLSMKGYVIKKPHYTIMWIIGLIFGFYILFIIHPFDYSLYLIVGFGFTAVFFQSAKDNFKESIPSTIRKPIFMITDTLSHLFIGLTHANILYYTFIECFYRYIIQPLFLILFSHNNSNLWIYLWEGYRSLLR